MQNAQEILIYSTITVMAVSLLAGIKVGISSYGATLGNQKFRYRLDRTRLPVPGIVMASLAALLFVYGLIISRDAGLAIEFCLATTVFAGIGLTLRICYVRK